MELIDEKGRLFGRVNIVDVLVVLFAIAVLAAGAALVFGDDPNGTNGAASDSPPDETLHVMLVATGDAASTLDAANVTIAGEDASVTDIHRTPGPRVFFRVALDGVRTEGGFRFADNPVRVGETYAVTTETVQIGTRVVERDVSPSFNTESTTVQVSATVRRPVAEAVATGDEQIVGNTTVATIESVETTAINDTHSELRASVELETRFVDDVPYYAGRPVRLGRSIVLETNTYEFEAETVGLND